MPTAMPGAAVTFPMLGDWFVFTGSNTYSLFGLTFHWYGVIIATGFLLGVLYCLKTCRNFGITDDELTDAILYGVPIGIIGARLYYVLFRLDYYLTKPAEILMIWTGGLAIFGCIIAIVIFCVIFCRHRKIPIGALLDVVCFGLLIGQSIGRWANFVNREAFGAVTDIFCRMGLTLPGQETIYVHPTFLYESLWNLCFFIILLVLNHRRIRKFDGQYFLMYIGWYGLGRMIIESLRTDSLYLFNTGIRVSQLLAGLCFIAAGAALIIRLRRSGGPDALWVNRRPDSRSESSIE